MGYEKLFSSGIIFAHQYYDSLSLPQLYTNILVSKCNILGKAFMINIKPIQLISGMLTLIFESKTDLSYIPDNWILHLNKL